MADILLSSLVRTILEHLNSLVLDKFGLVWGFKKEMKKLERTLSTIQAVLEDAEEQQARSKALQNWLKKLKSTAYEAEDVVEEFAAIALEWKAVSQISIIHRVQHCFLFSNFFASHVKMGHWIKDIRERLDEIAAERSQFHLREAAVEKQVEIEERRQTFSFVIKSEVFGREQDKVWVVDSLTSMLGRISVIPIVGMGGIGKTTLAQMVYNDETVKEYFNLRLWVCISNRFDTRWLIKSIIRAISGDKYSLLSAEQFLSMEQFVQDLRDMLEGKRLLLVLDDVWDEDWDNWNRFKQVLACADCGTKIIVTTRSQKVALVMGTVSPYYLNGLPFDDCWSLFKQQAFGMGTEDRLNLVSIGKQIVKKCDGVPLAAKALGTMLRLKTEEHQWLHVKDSELCGIQENTILPILRLSFDHLPPHLKQCFAYCSIFPKGYEIDKDNLILLWMANGLIPSKGKMNLEDAGDEIFQDLLMGFFFQDIQKDDNGKITKFKMHDLMHDLAMSVSQHECSITQSTATDTIPRGLIHLSYDQRSLPSNTVAITEGQKLRTFLLLSNRVDYLICSVPCDISSFRSLRALDLSYCCFETLPISIANLIHIRYLNLSHSHIRMFPESFSNLRNVQTLILKFCPVLCKLPKGMRNMTSLRHLDIKGCKSLTHMPSHIGRLTHLQTLTAFIVGKRTGCRIGELHRLNLKGELNIKLLDRIVHAEDAIEAQLMCKPYVQSLMFSWGNNASAMEENDEDVLEALQPHQNLKRFCMKNYKGLKFSRWMMEPVLKNLVEVQLIKCRRVEDLPPLGQLSSLKALYIEAIDVVRCIGNSFYGSSMVNGFPALEELTFKKMPNLEEWSSTDKTELFPCLGKLTVDKCPKLKNLPFVPSLRHMVLKDSNQLLLRSVENFTSLSTLHIDGLTSMTSLPDKMVENLSHLNDVNISSCPQLKSLPQEWRNRFTLHIWNCNNLNCSEATQRYHSSAAAHSSSDVIF